MVSNMDIEVGGRVQHVQTGIKIELGTASDHLVIYTDTADMDTAKETIQRATALHQFAKELKAGFIPSRPELKEQLKTEAPGAGKKAE